MKTTHQIQRPMKKLVGLKFWSAWCEDCLTVMILSLISASCLVVSTSEVPSNADRELVFYLYYVEYTGMCILGGHTNRVLVAPRGHVRRDEWTRS